MAVVCYQVIPELSTVLHSVGITFTSPGNKKQNSLSTEKKTLGLRQRQEAFTLRYDALYRWACRLTNDPVEAEVFVAGLLRRLC